MNKIVYLHELDSVKKFENKTKEYIGEGIYHLFDYQFLYNTVVNLITSGI